MSWRKMKNRKVNNMAFQRIGTPVDLSVVDFGSKDSYEIICEHCGAGVGRGNKRLAKFAGTETVIVSPREFVCPHCGKKSKVTKEK
jgi:Zn finger protein HypA/HybF involved in hydrogenase expression